jgi:SHS2 domain-containing protein
VTPTWEHFPHARRLGLRGFGSTKAEAFEQAALALTAAFTDPAAIGSWDEVVLECRGADDDALLHAWLAAVAAEMAARRMLFSRYRVYLDDGRLVGHAWGDAAAVQPPAVVERLGEGIAGVARQEDGWIAQALVHPSPASFFPTT